MKKRLQHQFESSTTAGIVPCVYGCGTWFDSLTFEYIRDGGKWSRRRPPCLEAAFEVVPSREKCRGKCGRPVPGADGLGWIWMPNPTCTGGKACAPRAKDAPCPTCKK